MLLLLMEEEWPMDEVVFYDTGMEFEAIYRTMERVRAILEEKGIAFTILKPGYDFEWKMFDKPVKGRNGFHYGYSWCGGKCRWGTRDKLSIVERYCKGSVEYVGIAADEGPRLEKERKGMKVFPLAEMGMTEADCLRFCYDRGFFWEERTAAGPVRLYDILDRVSCWCCANKNLKELRNVYRYLPNYWRRLEDLQERTERPMKGTGKSVFDLKERFEKEIEHEKV